MGLDTLGQQLLLALVVTFAFYMAYEGWRWVDGNRGRLTPGQFRRRLVGGILLETDLLMWFFAQPVVRSGMPARWKLVYLLGALLLLLLPMLLAVREAAFVMRQYARWRGDLIRSLGKQTRPEKNGAHSPADDLLRTE